MSKLINQTDALISEAQFQETLVEYAELWGWLVWHDNDSRRNDAGLNHVADAEERTVAIPQR